MVQRWDKLLDNDRESDLLSHLRDEGGLEMVEITVYQQTSKNGCIKIYCEECKPQGRSERGTLIVSGFDHFCDSCGEDFKDSAEGTMAQQAVAQEFCIYCDTEFPREQLVCIDVAYDEQNQEVALYSCEACCPVVWRHAKQAELQREWAALQSVPAYCERYVRQD